MVLENIEEHECNCEYCNSNGDIEFERYICEICDKEYSNFKKANDCEKKHKNKDDLLYGEYLFKKESQRLSKHANHKNQTKLVK